MGMMGVTQKIEKTQQTKLNDIKIVIPSYYVYVCIFK